MYLCVCMFVGVCLLFHLMCRPANNELRDCPVFPTNALPTTKSAPGKENPTVINAKKEEEQIFSTITGQWPTRVQLCLFNFENRQTDIGIIWSTLSTTWHNIKGDSSSKTKKQQDQIYTKIHIFRVILPTIMFCCNLICSQRDVNFFDKKKGPFQNLRNPMCCHKGSHNLWLILTTQHLQTFCPKSGYIVILATKVRVCCEFCDNSAPDLGNAQKSTFFWEISPKALHRPKIS